MNTTNFDNLPDDIKKKVIEANQNYYFAVEINELISNNFAVCDLSVAVTSDKTISLSGIVDDEIEKQNIGAFLNGSTKVNKLTNGLTIFENKTPLLLTINRQKYKVLTLKDLERVFSTQKDEEFREYCINGHGETAIILLMNKTNSLAIYFRFDGDSGFTTTNPKGENEKMQEFILSNGQKDIYAEDKLVNNRDGFDILRYYLLTGKMYSEIEWKEEK